MPKAKKNNPPTQAEIEALSERWDKIVFYAQGSPFENLSVNCIAKSIGARRWSRSAEKGGDNSLGRYIYQSFEKLLELEQMDLKTAKHLLEICESTMLFVNEASEAEATKQINEQASVQRMRILEEYGLYQDYPVALANLDEDFLELCKVEGIDTLIDLMGFIDRLSERAWIGGNFRNFQNAFAHGDVKGISQYFPYRKSHRGFHLPEALSFCLKRLSDKEREAIYAYHAQRFQKKRRRSKPICMPDVVETRLLQEIFQCLHYFGQRQPKLILNLYDRSYVSRELMYLNDPETETVIHWLLNLALAIFRPAAIRNYLNEEELSRISTTPTTPLQKELKDLLEQA